VILFQKSKDLQAFIEQKKTENLQIGFVPTMGALHLGHLSLIRAAKKDCEIVICSIFVNPTQFNQIFDLENYPRPIENDVKLLVEANCDVLFHPDVNELYGGDFTKDSSEDYGPFVHVLEGESRPGHFDGVVTIVSKLFKICRPNQVYFGQKDYQQCLVVKTLISREFSFIQFNLCPIERELDGLAMSSRNVRLNDQERKYANNLFKALEFVQKNWNKESWKLSINEARATFLGTPFEVEYFCVCDSETLEELTDFKTDAIVLAAATLGNTRLIDNLLLHQ
jgi:pantoate--beta-alanine ligase